MTINLPSAIFNSEHFVSFDCKIKISIKTTKQINSFKTTQQTRKHWRHIEIRVRGLKVSSFKGTISITMKNK